MRGNHMGKYVKFNARFSFEERAITERDWAGQGIEHDTVTWNQANNWMVPASSISDDAWPYIEGDRDFNVVDVEKTDTEQPTTDDDNPPPLGPSPGSEGSAGGGTGGQTPGSSTGGTGSSG
jgi:hypothetical protein